MNEESLPPREKGRFAKGSSVLRIVLILVCLSVGSVLFIQWFTKGQNPNAIPADALSKIEQEKAKAQKDYQDFIHTPAGKIWQKHPHWDREVCARVAAGEVVPGMSREQAAEALGAGGKVKRTRGGAEEEWVTESQEKIILQFEGNVLKMIQRKQLPGRTSLELWGKMANRVIARSLASGGATKQSRIY